VEGSVRISGEGLRINTQLIETSTGLHIWARTYDHEMQDMFALQAEISEAIVGALYPEVMKFESRRLMAKDAADLDAWESAHRAWGHFLRLTEHDNEQARALFRRSVDLDPSWSWSHAGLALTHHQRVANQWSESPAEDTAILLRFAERAVQLDDNDPAAHHALGHAYEFTARPEEMIAAFRRGVSLNPSDSIAHSCLGRNLAFAGRSEEAIVHLEEAIRLSPQDPWTFLSLFGIAAAHLGAGRYEEAIGWALRSTRWQPNAAAYRALAVSYAHLGRLEEAREALQEMHRLQPGFSLADLETIFASADRDFVERVSTGLRIAGLEK
jgi:pentatricopeptide repeat protein